MTDPFAIFAAERPEKRETLQLVWPDLYAALNRPRFAASGRVVICAIDAACDAEAHGRVAPNGTPACIAHGGTHPLDSTWEKRS